MGCALNNYGVVRVSPDGNKIIAEKFIGIMIPIVENITTQI